jgi:hypothetical protein
MSEDKVKELTKSPFDKHDLYDKMFDKVTTIISKYDNVKLSDIDDKTQSDFEDLLNKTKDAIHAHVLGNVLDHLKLKDLAILFFDKATELGYSNLNESLSLNEILEEKYEMLMGISILEDPDYIENVKTFANKLEGYDKTDVINTLYSLRDSKIVETTIDDSLVGTQLSYNFNGFSKDSGIITKIKDLDNDILITYDNGVSDVISKEEYNKLINTGYVNIKGVEVMTKTEELVEGYDVETREEETDSVLKYSVFKDTLRSDINKMLKYFDLDNVNVEETDNTVSYTFNKDGLDMSAYWSFKKALEETLDLFDIKYDSKDLNINIIKESGSINLELDIANDLLPSVQKQKSESGRFTVKDLEHHMLERGANLQMIDNVVSELVELGFEFDIEIDESYEDTVMLTVKFSDVDEFNKAKDFFSTQSSFNPDYINNEFMTIDFETDGQDDADSLENYIDNELTEYEITAYSFISENKNNDPLLVEGLSKDKVKEIRQTLKTEFPQIKFSITSDYNSITVAIMQAPINFLENSTRTDYEQLNPYLIENEFTGETKDILLRIKEIIFAEQRELTYDGDYGSVPNYYANIHVGKWDRPFIYTGSDTDTNTNIENMNENKTTRPATELEKDVFLFLNGLRESGVTNMFGATTYILDEFPELDKKQASKLLSLWMSNFNNDGNYDMIKEHHLADDIKDFNNVKVEDIAYRLSDDNTPYIITNISGDTITAIRGFETFEECWNEFEDMNFGLHILAEDDDEVTDFLQQIHKVLIGEELELDPETWRTQLGPLLNKFNEASINIDSLDQHDFYKTFAPNILDILNDTKEAEVFKYNDETDKENSLYVYADTIVSESITEDFEKRAFINDIDSSVRNKMLEYVIAFLWKGYITDEKTKELEQYIGNLAFDLNTKKIESVGDAIENLAHELQLSPDFLAHKLSGKMIKFSHLFESNIIFDENDLDEFEKMMYDKFISSGLTKEEALDVLINNVEGDTSQLSDALLSYYNKTRKQNNIYEKLETKEDKVDYLSFHFNKDKTDLESMSEEVIDQLYNELIAEKEKLNELRSVKITFSDGNAISTSMAEHLTDEEIYDYYAIGKEFNVGRFEEDDIQSVVDVEILENKINESHTQVYKYNNIDLPWELYDSVEKPEKPAYNHIAVKNLVMQDSFLRYMYEEMMTGNYYDDMDMMYNKYIKDDEDLMEQLKHHDQYSMYQIRESLDKNELGSEMVDFFKKFDIELDDQTIVDIYDVLPKAQDLYNEHKQNYVLLTTEAKTNIKSLFENNTIENVINSFKDTKITLEQLNDTNILESLKDFNMDSLNVFKQVLEQLTI